MKMKNYIKHQQLMEDVAYQKIGDFYEKYTGYKLPPKTVGEWIEIDDYKLATVTNGAVFKDNEDKFSQ